MNVSKLYFQLLNEMKGQLEWEEQGQEGTAPNCVFSLAVRAEDNLYTGARKVQ